MKIQLNKITRQLSIAFPLKLMEAMGWNKGDIIEPSVQGKDMILLRKIKKSGAV